MTIEQRIDDVDKKFEKLRKERETLITESEAKASEILTEMTRLQGEWRVLQDLLKEQPKVKVRGEK